MKPSGKRKRPTHLGRYELIEEIGRGGMGVIFKGHDPRHDREVAIKVLPKQGGEDTERVARFKREVQTIAMLSHQGVVRIFDVGEDEGRYYFVMEYVEGESIKAAVGNKGISTRRGLEIIEQMCRAIGHAHRKGVIHRDINPNNILLDGQGRPVLIDFGIAKLADTSRLTRAGATIGTPRYLSPEQALGEPNVDERTDVYGLGATLYLIATGRPPFSEAGGQTVSLTALEQGPTDPRRVNARVPREVEQIIQKAMARRREDRYRSCSEMATDIRSYLDTGKLALSHPGGLPKPLVIGLSAALALLIGGGAIAMFGSGGDPPRRTDKPDKPDKPDRPTKPDKPTDPGKVNTPKDDRPSVEALEYLADAKDHLAKQRWSKAVAAFTNAAREGAPKGEVYLGRAEANAGKGNFEAALKDIARAREDKDFGAKAEILERKLLPPAVAKLTDGDDLDGMIVMLDRWLAIDPDAAGKVGWSLERAFTLAKKKPGFVNDIGAKPDSPATQLCGALYNLRVKHQAKSAIETLQQLTADYPGFGLAWRALAGVQCRNGRATDAAASIRKVMWLTPQAKGLGAEAWIIFQTARDESAAGGAKDKALAELAGGGAGENVELAFARQVVAAYEAWDDPLGAAHACDYVHQRLQAGDSVDKDYREKAAELIQRWDLIRPELLPSPADLSYRRAVVAMVAPEAKAPQVEAALGELDSAALSDPFRMISTDFYFVQASLLLRLERYDEARAAIGKSLERDARYPPATKEQAAFVLAAGDVAQAATLLKASLSERDRQPGMYSPGSFLLRLATALEKPQLGLQAWVEGFEQVIQEQANPVQLRKAILVERRNRITSLRNRTDRIDPSIIAFEAAARHLAGEDAVARAQIGEAALRLADTVPGADGHGPVRVAAGLSWLAARIAAKSGKDAAGTWRLLRDLIAQRAAWDLEDAPAGLRRKAWMNIGRAALKGGCNGRARQAFARAAELGATGGEHTTLSGQADAGLQRIADTAYDRLQLGHVRQAAGDADGAQSAWKRARSRESDGTLLPEDREALAGLIK
jgi:serine/threonine protein kinase